MLVAARIKIYFDGGCRPNPGQMEIAVVVSGIARIDRDVGLGTGMDAEWRALIEAARVGQSLGGRDYILLGDAVGVINQATGRAKCRNGNAEHFAALQALVGAETPPRIRYIKRAQNLAGIALARGHAR